jgi:hypothetical protein
MGRLSNLRQVDPVLTTLATGYTNDELVADQVLPVVDLDKEAGKIPKFGKEAFRLHNTERALRAASNRISPDDIGSVDVVMDEHDLEYPIDYREDAEAAFDLEAHATYRATEGVLLRREKAVADLVQNPANFPVGSKIALSGTDLFTNVASDPEAVVATARAAVRAKIAKEPNTMVLGYSVLAVLERHAKLRAILSDSRTRLLTLDDLAAIFRVPRVVVGKAVQVSDAGVQSDIWGNNMLLTYVSPPGPAKGDGKPARSPYEPSFGYTLRKRGSSKTDTRLESGGKLEIVRYTEIYRPFILGADAGYLVSNVI